MIPVSKLSTIEMFQKSSAAALNRLAAAMETRSFSAGDIICKEGEPGTALFVIASGSVGVLKKIDASGAEFKKVAQLGQEEIFGEMAFLEQAPYSATVIAQEKSEILILPRTEMEKLIKQDPSIVLDQVLTLFSGISARLRQTTEELVALFEVARIIGVNPSVEELSRQVIRLVQPVLGHDVSFGFYLWNIFNEEYGSVWTEGSHWKGFHLVIDGHEPLISDIEMKCHSFDDISKDLSLTKFVEYKQGSVIISSMTHLGQKEGLLICYTEKPHAFSRKHHQLVETTSAVLAPALSNIRAKEDEKTRILYEQNRQQRS